MQAAAVASTALVAVAYDARRELLQLEFRNRSVYQYFGVPVEVHQALLGAPSKGEYFNRAIRGRFPYALGRRPDFACTEPNTKESQPI